MKTQTAASQAVITPAKALQLLKEGNERFVSNLKINRNLLAQLNETKDGQFPFAIILSCIDSRTSAELIFDQGLGDIFSARIAGNVLNDDILGSMEFACKLSGTRLIVVLGHSNCGAIKGACSGAELGYLTGLLQKVKPSLEEVLVEMPGVDVEDPSLVDAVARHNVIHTMDAVVERSSLLRDMLTSGEIGIAAAYYNLETGEVDFSKEILNPCEDDNIELAAGA